MAQYAADHRHPMNQLTHKLAIPVIVFHVMAMLHWVKLGPAVAVGGTEVALSLGHLGWVAVTVLYVALFPRLAPLMAVAFGLCVVVSAWTPAWLVVVLAVVGWTVQLAGHALFERNRPSFLTNMVQALVGPLFFAAVLTGAYRPEAAAGAR